MVREEYRAYWREKHRQSPPRFSQDQIRTVRAAFGEVLPRSQRSAA